jgi:hypothetical protein
VLAKLKCHVLPAEPTDCIALLAVPQQVWLLPLDIMGLEHHLVRQCQQYEWQAAWHRPTLHLLLVQHTTYRWQHLNRCLASRV